MVCGHCNALHWPLEKTSGTLANPGFGMCCNHGKVRLPPLQPTPPFLQQLLTANTPAAKHFRANIRVYNSMFQMASTGVLAIAGFVKYKVSYWLQSLQVTAIVSQVPRLSDPSVMAFAICA